MNTRRKLARPIDRVVDHTAEFSRQIRLIEEYETPRQKRLRCEREATIAQFHELAESVIGGLILAGLAWLTIHILFSL
jgi:hypothetical protein